MLNKNELLGLKFFFLKSACYRSTPSCDSLIYALVSQFHFCFVDILHQFGIIFQCDASNMIIFSLKGKEISLC